MDTTTVPAEQVLRIYEITIGEQRRWALSPAEIAERIGRDPEVVYRAIRAGDLPATLIGRQNSVLIEDVLAWLRGQRTA